MNTFDDLDEPFINKKKQYTNIKTINPRGTARKDASHPFSFWLFCQNMRGEHYVYEFRKFSTGIEISFSRRKRFAKAT